MFSCTRVLKACDTIIMAGITAAIFYNPGQPVGWCIADSEASEIIEVFLSTIKARSPTTDVRVVMTDDGTSILYIIL